MALRRRLSVTLPFLAILMLIQILPEQQGAVKGNILYHNEIVYSISATNLEMASGEAPERPPPFRSLSD